MRLSAQFANKGWCCQSVDVGSCFVDCGVKYLIAIVRKSYINNTLVHKSNRNVVAEPRKTSNGHGCRETVYFCV